MRPITLSRLIVFPEKVQSIKDVYIEDDIKYDMNQNDLNCKGKVKINFKVNFELESKNCTEVIDLDVVLSLAKIDCAQDLKLQFKDYIVTFDERLVKFTLRYELLGNGEKVISFKEVADEKIEEDLMKALNRNDEEEYKVDQEMINELLNSENVEVIGADELVPLTTDNVEPIEEVKEEESSIELEPVIVSKVEERNIDENKEQTKDISSEKKNEKLFKETYKIAYFFYKVDREEVTYEDIANKFNVDLDLLKSNNKDEKLFKGKLVKIPK
ncbi:MAG TPA: hypothetical protein DCY93_04025 [Firmicutes bacterium]|nr:hypothetical protein [Bacillota bacterium]